MKNSVFGPLAFVATAACGDNQYIVEGAHYQYVVSTIKLPVSATDAVAFAIDLDGDSNPDNNLGQSLDLLKGFGFDIRSTVAEGVRNGGILMGLDLQTTDFFDADVVAVQPFVGLSAVPAPCSTPDPQSCGQHLLGGAQIRVAPVTDDGRSYATGPLVSGRAELRAHAIPIQFSLADGVIVDVTLHDAAIRLTDISADGANAILAGVLSKQDIDTVVLPQAAIQLRRVLAQDCTVAPSGVGCHCHPNTGGASVAEYLDVNHDCQLSDTEVLESSKVRAFVTPDILDSSVGDGVSFAVRTRLVSAQLVLSANL